MNNLPHVTHQQFVTGVAEKRFARAIHIKWPPAIMNQNGATAYLGDGAELLFSFAQRMTLLQELTLHRLTASQLHPISSAQQKRRYANDEGGGLVNHMHVAP